MNTKWLCDESVAGPIFKALRQHGYEIISIAENSPGISDESVLQEAVTRKIPLITADKDFGELAYRLGYKHFGIVLIRNMELPMDAQVASVVLAFDLHSDKFPETFTVITAERIRIRRLPSS